MVLDKERFRLYKLKSDNKDRTLSVKLNPDEQAWIRYMKKIMQQDKEATLMKQLATIGTKVILDTPEGQYFQEVAENLRKNKRLGIVEIE